MKQYDSIYNHYIEKIKANDLEDYQVLDWESENAQYKRFSVFGDNFCNELKDKTIADIGCGLGNFAQYLDSMEKNITYDGYDIIFEMIELANQKTFSNITANFYHKNIFKNSGMHKKYHYIYCSGIFNLNVGNNIDFFHLAMDRFFEITTDGICFNLLDKKAKDIFGNKYFYYDKSSILSTIKSKYSDRLKSIYVEDSYLENDFSIVCLLR